YISKRVRVFEDPDLRDAVVQHGLPVSTVELALGAPPAQRTLLIKRAIAEKWDQMRLRDELQRLQDHPEVAALSTLARSKHRSGPRALAKQGSSRPPNFTRLIREFYRTILDIRLEDLNTADRSALRTLFKALVMLARTQTTGRPPVF